MEPTLRIDGSARPHQPSPGAPRILFLDDDPERAALFLAEHPETVWVQTAEQCLALLEQPWDEVYLDHDLGGEILVDLGRDDCGMAVVRWLCLAPRAHLKGTRFVVHSHNRGAAWLMVMQLQAEGFQVQARPFGRPAPRPVPAARPRGWWRRLLQAIRRRARPADPPPARPS
jgi:hypothetical protein